MMPKFPPTVDLSGAPDVGAAFKILAAYSTAVIECQCEAKTVLTLHGQGRVSRCKACNTPYGIAKAGVMHIGQVTESGLVTV